MHSLTSFFVLSAVMLVAVCGDLRHHRISNKLSLFGVLAGLGLETIGDGTHGVTTGLLGVAGGLACFAPFYLLRGMGAGDVKLLAAVGAFLGPLGVLHAAIGSLLAGGVGAISYVVWRALRASVGVLVHEGLAAARASAFIEARLARRDRLPFALPIAVGSLAACGLQTDFTGVTQWLL